MTRAIEYDLLPTCQRLGTGVVTFSPLAGGWLSGKYRKGADTSTSGSSGRSRSAAMDPTNPANARKLDAVDKLAILAEDAGLTLVQLATAFTVRHPAITSTIIGPRTMAHLDGYLKADGVELTDDVLDRIDEIVPPAATVDIDTNLWRHGTTALEAAGRRG